MNGYVRVETDSERLATLWLDAPGKSVNTLNRAMWADLDEAVAQFERDTPAGVIIASAKNRTFVAGADLFEVRDMDRPALEQYLADGQRILARLAALKAPTVAAINGDALGGGLELALACGYRVASDDKYTIGLPETKLGLVPGWGGTVRLPKLIGLREALSILVGGKALPPREALKLGIVDECVPPAQLLTAARKLHQVPPTRRFEPQDDAGAFADAEREAVAKQGRYYPAPLRVVQVAKTGWEQGIDAGYRAELQGLCDLRESLVGRNLMRAFFLRTGAKKTATKQVGGEPLKVEHAVVIGGGVMGSGVVHAMLKGGIRVDLLEVNEELAERGRQRVAGLFDDDAKSGRIDAPAAADAIARFSAGTKWDCVTGADFVLEAIVEQIEPKRQVLARVDRLADRKAVLASNTSSLSISDLSHATSRPQRVVGLHFFNPVPKMALVEIVRTGENEPEALATAVALATRLGKSPVLSGDGPGFIVNRVLMPYLSESMRMVCEGVSCEEIDLAMLEWGMPMGPLALSDQIGLDVISGIFRSMAAHLGERVLLPDAMETAVARKWLGRKTGKGFYAYPEKGSKTPPTVNEEFVRLLGGGNPARDESAESIQYRLMLPMVNEAARVLEEHIADSPDAIDLATLLGLGFPAFRGGLWTFAESVGAAGIVKRMHDHAARYGPRYEPAAYLTTLASQ
ncbi:MAG: 3-hydroxyacyl-CoA dehydrogenase NAD-binding domain-containing protein [Tepidisphaeraceae bacterium]